ncbi:META domain-containing protein [Nocardia sp. alder85J]|uniref:META domain-containing protein n=1 Tax=Nocardia sp. alder85J TaxID=2862949 RepID=UPI001CD303C5|nr:META domain-containing protein [Nocardia sp. alder85J]MCX4091275.1 META domain-containing protein [Nocardia sp. alder85J]
MSATVLRALPVLAVAALTACSSHHDATADPMGRSFVSTEVSGTPIPGGGPMTLSFADSRVTADSGCDTSTGAARFDEDQLLVAGLATTLLGCTSDKAGADTWQAGLLQSSPTWKLDGNTLTLTGNNSIVTLKDKKIVEPDRPLTGTSWIVTTLIQAQGMQRTATLEQVRPTLTIAPDGTVTGSAGCNRLTGTADLPEAGNSDLTFHLATTRMACADEVMQVEARVLQALDGRVTATVDGDTLTLRNPGNHTGLVLRAE